MELPCLLHGLSLYFFPGISLLDTSIMLDLIILPDNFFVYIFSLSSYYIFFFKMNLNWLDYMSIGLLNIFFH